MVGFLRMQYLRNERSWEKTEKKSESASAEKLKSEIFFEF